MFHLPAAIVLALAGSLVTQEAPAADPPAAETTAVGEPVVLQLRGGGRIRGVIVSETADSVRFRGDALGLIDIPADVIVARLPEDAKLTPKDPANDPPPPGLFGTDFLAGWEKSLGLGFSGKNGDVNEFGINASLEGDYTDADSRYRFRSAYFYGETEGEQTQDEGFANLRRDWLLPDSPAFFWGEGRLNYNSFQAYRFRAGGFGGVGAAFWNEPETSSFYDSESFRLLGRLGAGVSHEFGEVDETKAEALASLEGRWEISETQTFNFIHTYFPQLDDIKESRNVTEASYTATIDQGRGLSIKLGIYNEYLSTTEDDSSHNSLTYFGQLVYQF